MTQIGISSFIPLKGTIQECKFICLRSKMICVGVLLSHNPDTPHYVRALRERRFWADALDYLTNYEILN